MAGMSRRSAGSNLANDVKCKPGERIYVSRSPALGSRWACGVVVGGGVVVVVVVVVSAEMVLRCHRENWRFCKTNLPGTYSNVRLHEEPKG